MHRHESSHASTLTGGSPESLGISLESHDNSVEYHDLREPSIEKVEEEEHSKEELVQVLASEQGTTCKTEPSTEFQAKVEVKTGGENKEEGAIPNAIFKSQSLEEASSEQESVSALSDSGSRRSSSSASVPGPSTESRGQSEPPPQNRGQSKALAQSRGESEALAHSRGQSEPPAQNRGQSEALAHSRGESEAPAQSRGQSEPPVQSREKSEPLLHRKHEPPVHKKQCGPPIHREHSAPPVHRKPHIHREHSEPPAHREHSEPPARREQSESPAQNRQYREQSEPPSAAESDEKALPCFGLLKKEMEGEGAQTVEVLVEVQEKESTSSVGMVELGEQAVTGYREEATRAEERDIQVSVQEGNTELGGEDEFSGQDEQEEMAGGKGKEGAKGDPPGRMFGGNPDKEKDVSDNEESYDGLVKESHEIRGFTSTAKSAGEEGKEAKKEGCGEETVEEKGDSSVQRAGTGAVPLGAVPLGAVPLAADCQQPSQSTAAEASHFICVSNEEVGCFLLSLEVHVCTCKVCLR